MCNQDLSRCPHWLGVIDFGQYLEIADGITDFSEAVKNLAGAASYIDLEEDRPTIMETAPNGLRVLIILAAEEGPGYSPMYWVEYDDDVQIVSWEIDRPMISSEGYKFFHPDPKAFAQKIKDDAERALAWVRQYLEEKDAEEEKDLR
jgi:hypothetical protein